MDKGDKTRHRIAGKADERRAADDSHRDRTSGLDRHPPQHQRAYAFDAGLDVILLAGRNAAGGQEQVVAAGHLLQRVRKRGALIAQNAEIADLAAEPLQHRHQHEAVGIEQLRGLARRSGRGQFVAGREHGDADAPRHVELGATKSRRERHVLRPQALTGLQRDKSLGNVFARGAHIGARPSGRPAARPGRSRRSGRLPA